MKLRVLAICRLSYKITGTGFPHLITAMCGFVLYVLNKINKPLDAILDQVGLLLIDLCLLGDLQCHFQWFNYIQKISSSFFACLSVNEW